MPKHRTDLLTKLRRIKYSIASTGLRRGLSDVATLALGYQPERDHSFDRQFGTDTAGSVATEKLGIADSAVREKAILYLPSPARVTRWMFNHIGIQHRDFTCVDLGCGKGRVLLVASEYPFQRVIGVEISSELSEIARRNAVKYQPRSRKCRDVEIQNTDATTFDLPETNILLHLYHPFDPEVTAAVLARLDESVAAKPRRIAVGYLLYSSAVAPVEEVFARFPWLKQTRYEQSVLGHYDWLFYSN
jgi:SAM-dependent methyltransferase